MHTRPHRSLTAALSLALALPVLMAAQTPDPAFQTAASQRRQVVKPPAVKHPGPPGTLVMAGRDVMQLQPMGYFTDQDRAMEVMRRIVRVLEPENDMLNVNLEPVDIDRDVRIGMENGKPVVQFKNITVATVTAADQKASGMSASQVAQMWANNLKAGLEALKMSSRTDEKRILEQVQVAVGGRVVANGVNGVTETAIADRIRRGIARDPALKETDLNVDVLSDQVIIRNRTKSGEQDVRRLERIIREEAGDRPINPGNEQGPETAP